MAFNASAAPLAFPALREHFSSVDSFKLAAFRACLAQGVPPAYHVGTASHAHIACRLRSDDGDEEPCTFFIGASNRDCASFREVQVNRVCAEHSCSPGTRARTAAAMREDVQRRIERVELRVREAAARRAALRSPHAGSSSGSLARGAKAQGEVRRREVAPPVSPAQGSVAALGSSSEDESSTEEEQDEDGGRASGHYPSAHELRTQVDRLLQNGDVPFPASTDTFASPTAILTLLYAYAQQRHFSIYRTSGSLIKTRMLLRCGRGHHRYASGPGGRCPVRAEVVLGNNGR